MADETTTDEVRFRFSEHGYLLDQENHDEAAEDARFDRWLAAEKAKWQAEAWERGFDEGSDYMSQWLDGGSDEPENPYEKGANR